MNKILGKCWAFLIFVSVYNLYSVVYVTLVEDVDVELFLLAIILNVIGICCVRRIR